MNRTGILRTASFSKSKSMCKECRVNPVARPGAIVCGIECAVTWQSRVMDKAARAKSKIAHIQYLQGKEALKTNTEFADEAQVPVNAYVNLRDKHKPCICCGKSPYKGVRHAGHFKARGANSFLRFHLWNIHSCCYSCNVKKGGNINEYRPNLELKIGTEKLDFLDCAPRSREYSKEYLVRFKKVFQKKVNRLKKRLGLK